MENIDSGNHAYVDLESMSNEIRILRLEPGRRHEPIKGQLVIVNLDAEPIYNALSYRWGDPNDKLAIEIDGNNQFRVTRNAESALRHIRSDSREIIIWVDAICINQQNIDERNWQVRLMQKIYKSAQTVYVWLEISLQTDHPSFKKLSTLNASSNVSSLGKDSSFWLPVKQIADDEYWTRAWVQQEVSLARRIVIQLRDITVDGNNLLRLQQLILEKTFDDSQAFGAWATMELPGVRLTGPSRPEEPGTGPTGIRFDNLIYALKMSSHLRASDPRDHIYAVFGLVNEDLASNWQIDYRLSVRETYMNAALFSIKQHGSVGFLALAFKEKNQQDLPSWVPDWSSKLTGAFPLKGPLYILNSQSRQGSELRSWVSKDLCSLMVYASRLDKINTIHPRMPRDKDNSNLQLLLDFVNILQAPYEILSRRDQEWLLDEPLDDIPDDRWLAFLRTVRRIDLVSDALQFEDWVDIYRIIFERMREYLAPDMLYKRRRHYMEVSFAQKVLRKYKRLVEMMRRFTRLEPSRSQMLDCWATELISWLINTMGRFLFVTDSGRLGQAPPEALPNDEIWAILHCPVPMVLRPVDGHFEVIGPCFLDDEDANIEDDLKNGLVDEKRYPLYKIELK
jgi:Heterokaryon incompatibility protein (HET)